MAKPSEKQRNASEFQISDFRLKTGLCSLGFGLWTLVLGLWFDQTLIVPMKTTAKVKDQRPKAQFSIGNLKSEIR
jgi:hypothetical protein